MDPRHQERINIVQNLFAMTFDGIKNNIPHPADEITPHIQENIQKIDELISKHAPKYPLDRIAKSDLSILRLAVYELLINPKEPAKVVINEAVELAKEMGNERSFAFVNAVLGSILKEHKDYDKTTE